ncbi:DUF4260 domain-containing protein [Flavobacterium sp. SUN052]|uniref:DUF4260 domain-containing protein n=1 Tax=Flavobacterium sp. SUN052 TaxID=3002441 RepID=UPI00237ECCA5|nr:DUF4260 domain-containing protein [Flavobacterium sp. SUN052]MEC4005351.1 DUF4260 domain-containing protein [Flavobacterium sp. SUN052]
MKNTIKLEELGLLLLFSILYFNFYNGSWAFYLALFFVPDISFLSYLINKKVATIIYNFFHHKGVMAAVILIGFYLNNDLISKVGLIFMAHSCFDRMMGYGLKYFDNFDHTHLGWIGKSKSKNIA